MKLENYGLLNINKPKGPTSHDIVARVRRETRVKKVGHTGTLDPMATGVMVLCLGPATRLAEYVVGSIKTYVARVRFGIETDTYDADGSVTAENPAPISREAVEAALDSFRGTIEQIPPMYSAIQIGGRRLYDMARAGEEVEREPRTVTIEQLDLLLWEPPLITLRVVCSTGTYIRSLAFDLGRAVGVGAHLAALERTAAGMFTVENAVYWPDLQTAIEAGTWRDYLLPPDLALAGTPEIRLDAAGTQRIRQGLTVPASEAHGLARAYDPDGLFFAVLTGLGDQWKPHKVLLA